MTKSCEVSKPCNSGLEFFNHLEFGRWHCLTPKKLPSYRKILTYKPQRVDSVYRCHHTSMGNHIVEIRLSYDRLISTMRFFYTSTMASQHFIRAQLHDFRIFLWDILPLSDYDTGLLSISLKPIIPISGDLLFTAPHRFHGSVQEK